MTGRVKYRSAHPQPLPSPQRNLARMPGPQAPAPPGTASSDSSDPDSINSILSANLADPKAQILNKHTIAWLVVIIVIVLASLVIISWLLCRCKRRRTTKKVNAAGHSHHPSLEVTDGRNQHAAWNKIAPQGPIQMVDRANMGQAGGSSVAFADAGVAPAGSGWDGERAPAVRLVDENDQIGPLTPVSARNKGREKEGSRYGFSNAWGRISQIGKAY